MLKESIAIALRALLANKLRSILTMLGIIIGVGAVISMVSIGMGVRDKVQNSIASLGSNMLIVSPGAASSQGVRSASGSSITLSLEDAEYIKKMVQGIDYVAPAVSKQYQVIAGNQNWTTTVYGITPEYMAIKSLTVGSGSFVSQQDINSRNRVAVLGATVAENLFGELNPTGQNIRINNTPYQIIGILDSKGQSTMGQDQDDIVLVPLTTAQERLLGITYLNSISIQVTKLEGMDQAQEQITSLLRQRHKISGTKEDDFTVRNLTSIMAMMTETTGTITLFLGCIGAISLLVGGIGIMNIMMVSVTERTREIGIRKALGATYRDIMLQFLIESVVIGVLGGIFGIALGVSAAFAISTFGSLKTVLSAISILVPFGVSVAVGLFFGIYPARKAALLDPIEALRYE
ncbi:Macrolide export ATP-binding/permease protein MacB [Sporomusa silvacetica DSM 10669]|uniref:Macrolide export ATP-binding/permease protein MacB n=1 Tax=Sporomusa silvacetica DSM 10669 TaxID=1123289 RepID=A0ABZ3IG60_9FIRM|nr:ABC transporter permease [Sporomusa silvacetica]OZC16511.1 macrolide export ATP-binding/permease protein MacB [Sporomusa silvacetica DSM 10669]